MPLHLYLSGRHIGTLTRDHLTLALLAVAAAVLFGIYVHVVEQAVEQGRRHSYQMQREAVPEQRSARADLTRNLALDGARSGAAVALVTPAGTR